MVPSGQLGHGRLEALRERAQGQHVTAQDLEHKLSLALADVRLREVDGRERRSAGLRHGFPSRPSRGSGPAACTVPRPGRGSTGPPARRLPLPWPDA